MPYVIRIALVDRSATDRALLKTMLGSGGGVEVVADVGDTRSLRRVHKDLQFEAVVLTLGGPFGDDLVFAQTLVQHHQAALFLLVPEQSSRNPACALISNFARATLVKPTLDRLGKMALALREQVLALRHAPSPPLAPLPKSRPRKHALQKRAPLSSPTTPASAAPSAPGDPRFMIGIGSSTGGTETVPSVLEGIPEDCPPILLVQHMPAKFTRQWAQYLDRLFPLHVVEASSGMTPRRGCVLIAPGGYHMTLASGRAGLQVRLSEGPKVHMQRPSIDVLFESMARVSGRWTAAALLTGMGRDGAKGLLSLKNSGAATFAESESSAVVFGMPKVAIELGAATSIVHAGSMASEILQACA